MEKEVDRRQFLAHVGAGVLMLVGVTGMLKSLGELGQPHKRVTGNGYGGSAYGGGKDKGSSLLH